MPSKHVTVSSIRVVTRPTARCKDDKCGWRYPSRYDVMGAFVTGREVRAEAKSHVQFKPSHVVTVVISDVTSYSAGD